MTAEFEPTKKATRDYYSYSDTPWSIWNVLYGRRSHRKYDIHRLDKGFLTSGRGKKELTSCVYVKDGDHINKLVSTIGHTKATLNAPLLDTIFKRYPQVVKILHFHTQMNYIPTLPWHPPGTWEDSQRQSASFNIDGHGCILSFNKDGEMIK